MRTGDSAFHAPTGETWLVAFVDEGRDELVPCGWPLTFAKLSDCTLVKACTDEESAKVLRQLRDMHDQSDPRSRWAQRQAALAAPEGWHSKAGWSGKAHYVLPHGRTACAGAMGPRGTPMSELLTCHWKELDPNDHLCALCARRFPRACRCGVCRIRPTPNRSTQ
ncbi:MAG: hypothetical protein QOG85_824 [Gaiellaceae bacterium]|jgi:hypothetical protein|nr:hypothetical protein [Gaiellaceae bacterium]